MRDIEAALHSGELTARQLVQYYLDRIHAYDQRGPALRSIIALNPDALRDADALDERLRAGGPPGPLHGMPVLLKDNIDVAGLPTTAGSYSLEGNVPVRDAFITARLRAAGAIILAKTNLHEFAMWGESVSALGGQVRNPYDLTRTPGGSSGGTGAAVAAGFGALGVGTDTINSVRSPASANSLVGLRPTLGLVSRTGLVPYSLSQDTAGPITRSVADAARMLDVLAGADPEDPETAHSAGRIPPTYMSALRTDGLQQARIGVLRSFFGNGPEHAEVNRLCTAALDAMVRQGATLVPLDDPIDGDALLAGVSVHVHEFERDVNRYFGALPPQAPAHSLADVLALNRHHPGIDAGLKRSRAMDTHGEDYRQRVAARVALQAQLQRLMDDARLDAIAFPHQKRLVAKIGAPQIERNGVLAAVLGWPALVVPAGFSAAEPDALIGVPVGLELMGRRFDETTLLRLGYAFEQATRLHRPPPGTPPLP